MIELQVGAGVGPDHVVLLPANTESWIIEIREKLVYIRGKYAEMKTRKEWSENSLRIIDRQCENQCQPYLKLLKMIDEDRTIKVSLMNQ